MKLSMLDSINKIHETPNVKFQNRKGLSAQQKKDKAKADKNICFGIIKAGELSVNKIAVKMKVHYSTIVKYIKELSGDGLIKIHQPKCRKTRILGVV